MGKRRDGERPTMGKKNAGKERRSNAKRSKARYSKTKAGNGKRSKPTEKSRRGDETSSIERFLKGDANERPFKGILDKGVGDLVDPSTGFKRIRGGSFVDFRFANRDEW